MNQKNTEQIDRRAQFLITNWNTLFAGLPLDIWQGPSKHFYEQVLALQTTNAGIENLVTSSQYREQLYSALGFWGLERMGSGGPKMLDYNEFETEIKRKLPEIKSFSRYQLGESNALECKKGLLSLFSDIKVLTSKRRLVANSKLLHFLLPQLAPIVDKQYIVRYFKSHRENFSTPAGISIENETEFYGKIFEIYHELLTKHPEIKTENPEDPLIVIDRGIVAYVREIMPKKLKKN